MGDKLSGWSGNSWVGSGDSGPDTDIARNIPPTPPSLDFKVSCTARQLEDGACAVEDVATDSALTVKSTERSTLLNRDSALLTPSFDLVLVSSHLITRQLRLSASGSIEIAVDAMSSHRQATL